MPSFFVGEFVCVCVRVARFSIKISKHRSILILEGPGNTNLQHLQVAAGDRKFPWLHQSPNQGLSLALWR